MNIIYRLLEVLGLVVVPKYRLNSFLICRRMRKIISKYKIDCVVDVGANIGQYANFLRKQVGYRGLIISFEPDPECFEQLEQASRSDDNWLIQNCALGQEETTLQLNLMKGKDFNSFLLPDNTLTDKYQDRNVVQSTVDVPVKRLDDVIPQIKKQNKFERVFLKLDTQGFDLEVFKGATECLNMIEGIQTEVSVMPIYENMPSIEESLNLFRSSGFEVSGLYAVSESRFPHAIEFDCILLPK